MSEQSRESPETDPSQDPSLFEWRKRNVLRGWTIFFLAVLFVLFLLILWQAVPVLLLMFAGALVALALRFASDYLAYLTKLSAKWSLSIVLVVLILLSVGGGFIAAPAITEQSRALVDNLHESMANLETTMRGTDIGNWIIGYIENLGEELENVSVIWARLAGMFTTTFGAIAGFFLTLTIGLFFAYNPRLYISGFLRLVPLAKRQRFCEIISHLGHTLRRWIVGQLISMAVLAVSTWVMLWILGVPLAFILGLLTGLLTFIPYLGPIIAVIPILLIAFVESPTLALYVLVLYLLIQNVEANVLMPIIFQKTVHLPPVLTIIAQILLGSIFGLIGVVLATPLMAAGIDLVKMIYVEDVLGDTMQQEVPFEPE
jgi:predicted PurR-regulated permease PerM